MRAIGPRTGLNCLLNVPRDCLLCTPRRRLPLMPNTYPRTARQVALLWLILAIGLVAVGFRQFGATVSAQEWEPSIRAFERQDKLHPVPPGAIVFTGSCSICYLGSLRACIEALIVINRRFCRFEVR